MASHEPVKVESVSQYIGETLALKTNLRREVILYDKIVADACLKLFREKSFKLEGLGYKQ